MNPVDFSVPFLFLSPFVLFPSMIYIRPADCWTACPHRMHTSASAQLARSATCLMGRMQAHTLGVTMTTIIFLPARRVILEGWEGLSRSTGMILKQRRRMDPFTPPRPRNKRSASLGYASFALDSNRKATLSRPASLMSIAFGNADSFACSMDITHADLQRHLDWTTSSQSPYVTTSFSFLWARRALLPAGRETRYGDRRCGFTAVAWEGEDCIGGAP